MSEPVTNEDLLREVTEMRVELRLHIENEAPYLEKIKDLIAAHGDAKLVLARITFINLLAEREEQRKALRRAVIEKVTVVAIVALIGYVAAVLADDFREIVKSWVNR